MWRSNRPGSRPPARSAGAARPRAQGLERAAERAGGGAHLDLINEEYPGWSVIGWCDDDAVKDTVESWAMKHCPEVDVSLIKIEDTQASLNGVPFAFIHQEEDTVRFFFYNYNFSWAVNHVE